ncbi:hypothetical protein ACNKHM_06845 [Shigella sonnei]
MPASASRVSASFNRQQAERAAAQSEAGNLTKPFFRFADGITAWGCGDPGADELAGSPPTVNLLAAKRCYRCWGRWMANA